ncbi:LysR family transcriptional regulator [Actinokineospora sp. HUAS TT18]|uniref:LysR family transcriptional regulator n=1 Tax=Actinokineospora sp. HUAS TT18 TaxID=3447451 RepID=UPI003F520816
MRIEARHLRMVLAVASAGSLRLAAMSMNLSQPALLVRLRRIELAVGGALFRRDGDVVVPTELGRRFLRGAGEVICGLSLIQERAAAMARPAEVRVGSVLSVLLEDLVEVVQGVSPGRRVLTQAGSGESLLSGVADGAVDFAIVIRYGGSLPGGLVVVEGEPAFVGLSASHPMAGQDEVALAELAAEEWIVVSPNDGSGRYDSFVRACGEAGFVPRAGHDVAEWGAMVRLIRAGLGVGLVSPVGAVPLGVVCRPIKGHPLRRDLVLCSHDSRHAEEVSARLRGRYLAARYKPGGWAGRTPGAIV